MLKIITHAYLCRHEILKYSNRSTVLTGGIVPVSGACGPLDEKRTYPLSLLVYDV